MPKGLKKQFIYFIIQYIGSEIPRLILSRGPALFPTELLFLFEFQAILSWKLLFVYIAEMNFILYLHYFDPVTPNQCKHFKNVMESSKDMNKWYFKLDSN